MSAETDVHDPDAESREFPRKGSGNAASSDLEVQDSRPNTASSRPRSLSETSTRPLSEPISKKSGKSEDATEDTLSPDQEHDDGATSSGDDVLLEEKLGSMYGSSDDDGEGDADILEDGSCSEGDLECESRDVGLGENPFASPSSCSVMAAEQHYMSMAMAPQPHLADHDNEPEQRCCSDTASHHIKDFSLCPHGSQIGH